MKQDREAIRMLVADIGYQETSKRTGIAYGTLRQWANRGKWNVTPKHSQAVTTVTKPIAAAHAEALAEHEAETRMSLARSSRRMAKDCEGLPVKHADKAYTVAKTAAIVHKWDAKTTQANVMVNIALLGVDPSSVKVDSGDAAAHTIVDSQSLETD